MVKRNPSFQEVLKKIGLCRDKIQRVTGPHGRNRPIPPGTPPLKIPAPRLPTQQLEQPERPPASPPNPPPPSQPTSSTRAGS